MSRVRIGAVIIGAGGFVALSFELLWYRLASFGASSTLAAFPLLLGSYLVGIALGSLGAERVVLRGVDSLRAVSAALAVGAIAGALVGFLFGELLALGTGYYPALTMFVIGSLSLGFTFPLLAHWAIPADGNVGARVSYLYASNIVGSVFGTILTGFYLLDVMTLATLTALLSTVMVGLFVLVRFTAETTNKAATLGIGSALTGLIWLLVPQLYDGIWAKLFYWEHVHERPPFVEVHEGRAGVVVVTDQGRALSGGVYDGTFSTELDHDRNGLFRAFAGPLMHSEPKRILVVGLATGSWATVLANAPGVEELVIIEIEHLWPRVIADREPQRQLFEDDRITWVFDDARRWMSAYPDEKFDLIVSNTTYHWRDHVSMLQSREFLELVNSHLSDDGIYVFNSTDSGNVWATALDAFPHVARLYNAGYASRSPIQLDAERWRTQMSLWSIYGRPVLDLAVPAQVETLEALTALASSPGGAEAPIERDASLRDRYGANSVITDDNLGNETTWTVVPRSLWVGSERGASRWDQ